MDRRQPQEPHRAFPFRKSKIKLGSGASCGVFLGRTDSPRQRLVAVKQRYQNSLTLCVPQSPVEAGATTPSSPSTPLTSLDEQEDRIMLAIGQHENIIECIAVCPESRHIILSLMDSTLGKELKHAEQTQLLNEYVARWLLFDLVSGVAHLHAKGIAHRDLKPDNVFLAKDLHRFPLGVRVVIGDFGSSHYASKDVLRDGYAQFSVRGTLHYIAPEGLLGGVCPSKALACDMWALGCIMYQMMYGSVAFCDASSQGDVLRCISNRIGPIHLREYGGATTGGCLDPSTTSWSSVGFDLLTRLLTVNPAERITVQEALDHPFFGDVREYYRSQAGGRLDSNGPTMVEYGLQPLLTLQGCKSLPPLSTYHFDEILTRSRTHSRQPTDDDDNTAHGEDNRAGTRLHHHHHLDAVSFNSTDSSVHVSALGGDERSRVHDDASGGGGLFDRSSMLNTTGELSCADNVSHSSSVAYAGAELTYGSRVISERFNAAAAARGLGLNVSGGLASREGNAFNMPSSVSPRPSPRKSLVFDSSPGRENDACQ